MAIERRPTLAQIRKWPPTITVGEAAPALGASRSGLYLAITNGTCPVQTVRVGGRIKILTFSLIEVLEGRGDRAESA